MVVKNQEKRLQKSHVNRWHHDLDTQIIHEYFQQILCQVGMDKEFLVNNVSHNNALNNIEMNGPNNPIVYLEFF